MSKKNNPAIADPSDLQKLITEFESIKTQLQQLDLSDEEEKELVADSRAKLYTLQEEVNGVIAGNERARREKQVKLANLQELLQPILFPNLILASADTIIGSATGQQL